MLANKPELQAALPLPLEVLQVFHLAVPPPLMKDTPSCEQSLEELLSVWSLQCLCLREPLWLSNFGFGMDR